MNESGLNSGLKLLGLTDYQAKSLIALMTIGIGTPRDVARKSGIPYPSAYDSLRSLAQSGWVEFASTRPSIFRVREPTLMKDKVTEDVNNLFGKLQEQYNNIRDESSKLALIYTIVGEDHVRGKIVELLDSAKQEALIVIPGYVFEDKTPVQSKYRELIKSIGKLSSRDEVNLKLITDDNFSGLNGIRKKEIRIRDSVLAIDLLIDQQKALIGLPDLSACGWVDSPIISSHFGQFLGLLWKDSTPDRFPKTTRKLKRRG